MNAIVSYSIPRHDISKESAVSVAFANLCAYCFAVVFILLVYILNSANCGREFEHVHRLNGVPSQTGIHVALSAVSVYLNFFAGRF